MATESKMLPLLGPLDDAPPGEVPVVTGESLGLSEAGVRAALDALELTGGYVRDPWGEPIYTPELVAVVAEAVAGGRWYGTLREVDSRLPSAAQVSAWRRRYPQAREVLAAAQEARADAVFERWMGEVEAAGPRDAMIVKAKGEQVRWALGKMAGDRFGDKVEVRVQVDIAKELTQMRERAESERRRRGEVVEGESRVVEKPGRRRDPLGPAAEEVTDA